MYITLTPCMCRDQCWRQQKHGQWVNHAAMPSGTGGATPMQQLTGMLQHMAIAGSCCDSEVVLQARARFMQTTTFNPHKDVSNNILFHQCSCRKRQGHAVMLRERSSATTSCSLPPCLHKYADQWGVGAVFGVLRSLHLVLSNLPITLTDTTDPVWLSECSYLRTSVCNSFKHVPYA